MKIDIHTHTKKCKSGDAPTREITPIDFCETLRSTDVGIIAITNHNVFDLEQYTEIIDTIDKATQVWPGIELDVIEDGARGHLLVIVSPSKAADLARLVTELSTASTPDTFTTTIDKVIDVLDKLEPLYIAHYERKKPNISDEALDKLIAATANPRRVIKEVANSISAGIYIAHGHPSIYGSDIHDWSKYEKAALTLPNLRLPVESYEHFCLLLEKDPTTINTVLDQKVAENLLLNPFEDATPITLKVFNDINIIFGSKGTGKSCILDAISKYYRDTGIEAEVYISASDRLDDIFDIKGRNLSPDLNPYGIHYCKDKIEKLRGAEEVGVTNLSKYESYFRSKGTNKNAQKIKIKDIEPEGSTIPKRQFNEFNRSVKTTFEFRSFINDHPAIVKTLKKTEHEKLNDILSDLLNRLQTQEENRYSDWKEVCFLNSAIEKFRTEVERKTGNPAKPTSTGFSEYAINRSTIEASANAIIKSFDTKIPIQKEALGSLGPNKGNLELLTVLKFQDGNITDSSLNKLKGIKKSSQKAFSKAIHDIRKNAYSDDLFLSIASLNEIEDIEKIETVYELLLFKRYFALEGRNYVPSSGEASMVMLQKELETDKEVYILDEPERSLGNEYINDVIVPLIEDRARAGKKIFISTHDANIAVRTLPYSSIFRCHGPNGYATYIGNPFLNDLVNLEDNNDRREWKKVSMKTLEGGEHAFGERGKIYGNY